MPIIDPASRRQVEGLFERFPYKRAHLAAALDRVQPADVFLDSLVDPSAGAIHHHSGNMMLAGDPSSHAVWDFINDQCRRRAFGREVILLCPESGAWGTEIVGRLGSTVPVDLRIYHQYRSSPRQTQARDQAHSDAGVSLSDLVQATEDSLDNAVREAIVRSWTTVAAFQRHGVGYQVLLDGRPVSICYSVAIGESAAPIKINTGEAFRRRGYGRVAAMAFLQRCGERHMVAIWECDEGNEASRSLANDLGFEETYRYARFRFNCT